MLAVCAGLRGADALAPVDPALTIPATDAGLPGAGPIRRADWFQSRWNERRAEFARRVALDQGALVFLGDSITDNWRDVGSSFPGVKTANRGIGGDTSRGVLIRLDRDVIALHPKGVVLLIGTNDLADGAAPAVIAGNVKLILDTLHRAIPHLPVVVCKVMPSSASMQRPRKIIQELNDLHAELVGREPDAALLDTWALFANAVGDADPNIFPDLLHPNLKGYDSWSRALHPLLENLGLLPVWPDDAPVPAGFDNLFNGRDFSGWHYAGQPALDGRTATPDQRYVVTNGRIVVTTNHPSHAYLTLWTTRSFPHDFVLHIEFRATPNTDSGIFLRQPQLQCRDFAIAGPWTNLHAYRPMDWNTIEVTVHGQLAHATCNGELLVDAMPIPADGPIGLESDHGEMEYRRIWVHELP